MRSGALAIALALAALSTLAAAQVVTGAWTLTTYQGEGAEEVPLMLTPAVSGGVAQLAIRCAKDAEVGVELVIALGSELAAADSYRVEVDLGVGDPLVGFWSALAGSLGVGLADYQVDMILMPAVLQEAASAAVTVTAPTAGSVTLVFDLEGLREGLKALGCYAGAIPL